MRVVLMDHQDSFVYNLVHALALEGVHVTVVQSTDVESKDILAMAPDALVLGAGPGRPEDAGHMVACVQDLAGQIPILGVCLGHQAIGLAFGASLVTHQVVHGHTSLIFHQAQGLFSQLENPVPMMRYHSLVLEALPEDCPLVATAHSDDGAIMGIQHAHYPIYGVQFHPESVGSEPLGTHIFREFLDVVQKSKSQTLPQTAPFLPRQILSTR